MYKIKYFIKIIINKLIPIVSRHKVLKQTALWILNFFPTIKNRLSSYVERNHLIEKGWCRLISGFGTVENSGYWSVTDRAVMLIFFRSNFFKSVTLSVDGYMLSDEYSAEIIFNGKKTTEWKNGSPFLASVPSEICSTNRYFEFIISIQNIVSPKEIGISEDSRMLGIFINGLKINNTACEIINGIDLNKSAKYFYQLLCKKVAED